MKTNKFVRNLTALALVFAAGGAQAVLLSELVDGASIQAGDKIFDQWSASSITSDFIDVNLANIDVVALNDGGLDPGPGLQYNILNGELDVTGDGIFAFRDLSIDFHVSTDGDLKIKDNSLAITGAILDNPLLDVGAGILETVATFPPTDENFDLGEKLVESSFNDPDFIDNLTDSIVFASQDEIYVHTDINVWAVDPGEAASLTGFSQRFSQEDPGNGVVPEPATLALLSLGLAGLGFSHRRSRG